MVGQSLADSQAYRNPAPAVSEVIGVVGLALAAAGYQAPAGVFGLDAHPVGMLPGGDGAGAGAEGCYRKYLDDGWRVCIAFGVLPRSLHSLRQALISALGSRLGDQVAVSSSRWGARNLLVCAERQDIADEAAQVTSVRCSRGTASARPSGRSSGACSPRSGGGEEDEKTDDPVAEQQALHEARQERERQASVTVRPPHQGGVGRIAVTRRCGSAWPSILPPRDGQ